MLILIINSCFITPFLEFVFFNLLGACQLHVMVEYSIMPYEVDKKVKLQSLNGCINGQMVLMVWEYIESPVTNNFTELTLCCHFFYQPFYMWSVPLNFRQTQNHYFVTFFNHDYIINDVMIKKFSFMSCYYYYFLFYEFIEYGLMPIIGHGCIVLGV